MTKGVAYILASAFGFALMAFFVRLCDDFGAEVSAFQKSFFRNFIALLIAAFFLFREKGNKRFPPLDGRSSALLILRSAFGTVGIFCNFYAISHIAMADAMTLNKTSPFFAVLFAWIFLGERATIRQALCLAFAFAGATLVIKPGWRDFGTVAALCGLAGGLAAGLAYTCVHELGRLKVDGAFIVLFFSAFSCAASIPFVIHSGYTPMTWQQTVCLLAAGASAAIGQFGVTAAYRCAKPRDVAVFDYSNIVFTAMLGLAFFGQVPDASSIAGFTAIVAAAVASRKHTSSAA